MKVSVEVAKALVARWNVGGTLLGIVIEHGGLPEKATGEDWDAAMERVGIPKGTYLRQDVRTWIARHFTHANAALWDGKQELAWKWMASGKDKPPAGKMRTRVGTEARQLQKQDMKGKMMLSVRERDKRHDWNTCK